MSIELPKGLSAPAIRALATIGVVDLRGLTRSTEAEVSALHGMGPKGIRMLKEALEQAGLSFKA